MQPVTLAYSRFFHDLSQNVFAMEQFDLRIQILLRNRHPRQIERGILACAQGSVRASPPHQNLHICLVFRPEPGVQNRNREHRYGNPHKNAPAPKQHHCQFSRGWRGPFYPRAICVSVQHD